MKPIGPKPMSSTSFEKVKWSTRQSTATWIKQGDDRWDNKRDRKLEHSRLAVSGRTTEAQDSIIAPVKIFSSTVFQALAEPGEHMASKQAPGEVETGEHRKM